MATKEEGRTVCEVPRRILACATPRRVLIVDDEPAILDLLSATLESDLFDPVCASSGSEGLRLVREEPFAIVISDQWMPGMTGLEFLEEVKRLQPHASLIMISGVADFKTSLAAINKLEICHFIVKPWGTNELIAAVRQASLRYASQCLGAAMLTRALLNDGEREVDQRAQELNLQHSVDLCLSAMQTFYPALGSHARRAFTLCSAMAASLRLSFEDRQVLEISAWLHDIGLLGISRDLIHRWQERPYSLKEAETKLIHQHPILGQELAARVHPSTAIGVTIRAHHERFDGKGYPDALRGEQIPWLGRLLAVAVGYATTQHEGLDAVQEIQSNQGDLYDAEAVQVLLHSVTGINLPRKQKEVVLSELRTGMILAGGIYNSNGVLLVPEDQELSLPLIARLRAHNVMTPIHQSILVFA